MLRPCDIYISVRQLCLVLFRGRASGQSRAPGLSLTARPTVEVLMFPASGVGLEADGCRQRKGFWKAAREQQMERRICLQVPSACQQSRD